MAKQQSFSDKLKKKKKNDLITVKFIKSMKTAGGNYKFNEKFVQLEDLNKLSEVKWFYKFKLKGADAMDFQTFYRVFLLINVCDDLY